MIIDDIGSSMDTVPVYKPALHVCDMRGRLDCSRIQSLAEVVEVLKMLQLNVAQHAIPPSIAHLFEVYDANVKITHL